MSRNMEIGKENLDFISSAFRKMICYPDGSVMGMIIFSDHRMVLNVSNNQCVLTSYRLREDREQISLYRSEWEYSDDSFIFKFNERVYGALEAIEKDIDEMIGYARSLIGNFKDMANRLATDINLRYHLPKFENDYEDMYRRNHIINDLGRKDRQFHGPVWDELMRVVDCHAGQE